MKLVDLLLSLLLLGIGGFLCLFLLLLNKNKKEIWDSIEEKEEKNGRN